MTLFIQYSLDGVLFCFDLLTTSEPGHAGVIKGYLRTSVQCALLDNWPCSDQKGKMGLELENKINKKKTNETKKQWTCIISKIIPFTMKRIYYL